MLLDLGVLTPSGSWPCPSLGHSLLSGGFVLRLSKRGSTTTFFQLNCQEQKELLLPGTSCPSPRAGPHCPRLGHMPTLELITVTWVSTRPCYSKYSSQNSSVRTTWELLGSSESQAPSQTFCIRICILANHPGEPSAHQSLKIATPYINFLDTGTIFKSCFIENHKR